MQTAPNPALPLVAAIGPPTGQSRVAAWIRHAPPRARRCHTPCTTPTTLNHCSACRARAWRWQRQQRQRHHRGGGVQGRERHQRHHHRCRARERRPARAAALRSIAAAQVFTPSSSIAGRPDQLAVAATDTAKHAAAAAVPRTFLATWRSPTAAPFSPHPPPASLVDRPTGRRLPQEQQHEGARGSVERASNEKTSTKVVPVEERCRGVADGSRESTILPRVYPPSTPATTPPVAPGHTPTYLLPPPCLVLNLQHPCVTLLPGSDAGEKAAAFKISALVTLLSSPRVAAPSCPPFGARLWGGNSRCCAALSH